MKNVASLVVLATLLGSAAGYAQENPGMAARLSDPKLIAVVNRANWCGVCKANDPRFGALLTPYAELSAPLN